MKFKNFNPFRKVAMGLTAAALSTGAFAEKAPATVSENSNHGATIETPEIKTDLSNNTEVVNAASFREQLQEKKTYFETENQHSSGHLDTIKNDFVQRINEVLTYQGYKVDFDLTGKPHKKIRPEDMKFMPTVIQTQVAAWAEAYADKQNLTSEESLNTILGILMAPGGALDEYNKILMVIQNQDMGSRTHLREHGFDVTDANEASRLEREHAEILEMMKKGHMPMNEDSEQRMMIHALIREIAKETLKMVKDSHYLMSVENTIAKVDGAPKAAPADGVASSETPTVDF